MCEPFTAPNANLAAQALYAKLQKLNEDIQLQHSIISAQKETVLKSRQRVYDPTNLQKTGPAQDQTHMVHTHAGTVLQHRAMIIKHYELIQQHKQMVKEQGLHVQNLTSALLNIQQETNVVDELMNTKMSENRQPPANGNSNSHNVGPSIRNGKYKRIQSKSNSNSNIDSTNNTENNTTLSPDISIVPQIENTKLYDSSEIDNNNNNEQITTITTTTSTTTTTPTITTTETTTISSISTPTSTSTLTSTTTTTTKTSPCTSPLPDIDPPLPLSP